MKISSQYNIKMVRGYAYNITFIILIYLKCIANGKIRYNYTDSMKKAYVNWCRLHLIRVAMKTLIKLHQQNHNIKWNQT